MFTAAWKVFGTDIGRGASAYYNWKYYTEDEYRRLAVLRMDITNDADSVIVYITRETEEECEREFVGQISDGLFENEKVYGIERIG